ncbi:triose-phosphate isomerase [Ruania albidiflava]|uniref:triose-phosphate isomerase n=1 Tax=Ruania albidiflava TaxID=366586 RepID=UPI0003B6CF21|nr:triose-phosphate isomerase [Ruania albidiflava]
MTEQTTWIGTSWKMTKTLAEARAYARVLAGCDWAPGIRPFVIPPATAIATVAEVLSPGGAVLVGAQDAHWEDEGAWTGEVSVPQVKDAGARLLEIGHSERRAHFAETDERVNLKVHAALRHGLLPLVCVGETAQQRAAGAALDTVTAQVRAALAGVPATTRVLLAYEPVWAIGEHGTPATPEQVRDVVTAIARVAGPARPVLYGGSVSLDNARDLLDLPQVSGLFVGRAAWDAGGFLALADLAAQPAPQAPGGPYS